jgi:putative membrane protein
MRTNKFFVMCAFAASLALSPLCLEAQHPGGQPMGSSPGAQPGQNPSMQQPMPNQTQSDTGSNTMMKSSDQRFAEKAAQGGMAEVQLGQLAAQKASSPEVKAFGQQMVDDHSKANDELKSVAAKENMTLPNTLDSKDQGLYKKLQNLSGTEFDKTYVKAMVKDHEEDVKEFQKEADKGKDAQIKNFASQTLPTLQQHLSKIQAIQSSMGNGGGGGAPSGK